MTTAEPVTRTSPYQHYVYAYPHKTAYRPLAQPRSLQALWAGEDRKALFAYVHVPFCTMRCGFCNLFAMAQPDAALVDGYVDAVIRQMRAMDRPGIARIAVMPIPENGLGLAINDRLRRAAADDASGKRR